MRALKEGLKSVIKGVGNGFKAIGSKIAEIIPGLIGSIVGFVFKTAGSVISFLGGNSWVLMMGVVFFIVEQTRSKF